MKKIIFSLCIIAYVIPAQAMKRQGTHKNDMPFKKSKINPTENKVPAAKSFHLNTLPSELQSIVIRFAILSIADASEEKKPKDGIKSLTKLILVNKLFMKTFEKAMLTLSMSDQIIDRFAFKYSCTHETIARLLDTPTAKKRLDLQYQLKELCFFANDDIPVLEEKLNQLVAQEANLDFSYNSCQLQRTPLMISLKYNLKLFPLLLKTGANINGQTPQGITLLMSVLTTDDHNNSLDLLLQNPEITVNQQNKRKETALLYALRKKTANRFFPPHNITSIKKLLDHPQTNPTLADKYGNTPYSRALILQDWRIIVAIQNAIFAQYYASTQSVI